MQIGKFDKVIGINAILRHFNGKIYVLQSICKSSHIIYLPCGFQNSLIRLHLK